MSNLDYPISVLTAERKVIATSLQRHGNDITKKKELLDGINSAIRILIAEKIRDESGIIEEEKAKKILMNEDD